MNLTQLMYFCTLAELEHYTKAAEKLNTTQPNISHAMKNLEEEIGLTLFEKTGRNIRLTKYGKIFYSEISQILENLNRAEEHMREIKSGKERLEIGFPPLLGLEFIPRILREFSSKNDDKITYNIYEKNSPILYEMLENNKCEVIFTAYKSDKDEYGYIPVVKKYLYVIVPENHPLASKKSVTLEEVSPYEMIMFGKDSGIRYVIDRMFENTKIEPKIAMEVTEDQVIAGFVAQGFGIAIVEDIPVLNYLPVKKLMLESNEYNQTFYMVWNKKSLYSDVLKDFIDFVEDNSDL